MPPAIPAKYAPNYGYTPLAAQAPTGVTATDFSTPAQSFDDSEKIAATLLAQELANQSNSIKVGQAQQESDSQNAVRQALQQQFGGDNVGAMDDTTLKQALQTAGKLYIQQGDTNSALNVQKQLKDQKDQTPLDDATLQGLNNTLGLNLPPGTTQGEASQMMRALGIQNTGTRNQVFQDRLKYQQAQGNAPGFVSNQLDENGNPIPMNNEQKKVVADSSQAIDKLVRNGDALIGLINGDRLPIGDPAIEQQQLIATMVPAVRQLQKTGMKFNEFIKSNDLATFGDDAQLMSRIQGYLTGQDPAAAVQRFLNEVSTQIPLAINTNGGVLNPNKIDQFDPSGQTSALYNKYGLFSRGSQMGYGTMTGGVTNPGNSDISGAMGRSGVQNPPLANYGVPRNPDGSILSKEQFLKLHSGGGM